MYCFSARTILIGLDLKKSLHDGLQTNNAHNISTLTAATKCVHAYLHCHNANHKDITNIVFLRGNLHFQLH